MRFLFLIFLLSVSTSALAETGIKITQNKYGKVKVLYVTSETALGLEEFDDTYNNLLSACFYGKTSHIKSILVKMAENSGISDSQGIPFPTYDEDGYELEGNFISIENTALALAVAINYNYTDELGINLDLELRSCK